MPTTNSEMQCPQRGNRKTEFRTSHGGVVPTRHTAPLRFQQGIAVLGIVAILLSAITFSAISTSQQVQQFYTIEKTKRDTEKANVTHMQQVKEIATLLRSHSVSQTLNRIDTSNATILIEQTDLVGEEQQSLQHFDVRVSQDESNTIFTAKFLRYPSLLRLPTSTQQLSWDNQLTEWLFNRSIEHLSATYFPQSVAKQDCVNLPPASIFWIEGDCQLDNEDIAHSDENQPLMLLIVDGDLSLHADTQFHGLIVMLSTTPYTHTLHVSPEASIKGAYVSNHPLNTNLDGPLTPSTAVLKNLQSHTTLAKIIPIPGSWYRNNSTND